VLVRQRAAERRQELRPNCARIARDAPASLKSAIPCSTFALKLRAITSDRDPSSDWKLAADTLMQRTEPTATTWAWRVASPPSRHASPKKGWSEEAEILISSSSPPERWQTTSPDAIM